MWNLIKKSSDQKKARSALTLGDAVPAVIALALIAIVGAVALLILQNFQSNSAVTAGTAAYNGIGYGITGIGTVLSFQSLLGLVIVAAIIIGVVVGAFSFGRGGGHREEF